jgi:hypothetical protein
MSRLFNEDLASKNYTLRKRLLSIKDQRMNQSAPVVGPLLAVCGLYCGACPHYRAALPEGKHLLEQTNHRSTSGWLNKSSGPVRVAPGFAGIKAHCQTCGKDLESYLRILDNTL